MKFIHLQSSFCLFLALLLTGCLGSAQLETRVVSGAKPENICQIAVLPFDNWTSEDQAGVIAQRIFHGSLINSGAFKVRPEGDVSLFRLRHRLALGDLLERAHFKDLQEKLQIDAIVQGRLTEAGMVTDRGPVEVPVVAMEMKVFAVQGGELILSTTHHRWGDDYRKAMHFGMVTTMTGLLARMSDEIIADWLERGLGNCQ